MAEITDTESALARIADALDRLAPPAETGAGLAEGDAFVWNAGTRALEAVDRVAALPLELLKGVDHQRDTLLANTRQFAAGYPANNALLWGARGMGKSSLVKAVHKAVNADGDVPALALIEIHREDVASLPQLLSLLRQSGRRCLLFCDDLSFEQEDASFKSLKAILEGGLEGRPENVLFYATSNRRHLMPRDMMENERSSAINPAEVVDEKVSLSDRFGLWLGFHACSQDEFLEITKSYASFFKLNYEEDQLIEEALRWSAGRGARSGRVAWQFIQDLAGRLECSLSLTPPFD